MEPHTLEFTGRSVGVSARTQTSGQDRPLRLFPAARPVSEVIGVFQRFGDDMQSFEVVSCNGQMSVRPQCPSYGDAVRARSLPVEETTSMLKAA